ncbi:hypothetical protein PIB30_076653 [Stylosanthes scabra]|uniref:Uncharacterized protein n=1 Tax=Stylosanthes scabra TaxID=79078 RepID=A0ABU6YMW5_9FABA|nr:hypothetical protein [Stylosanthes scabra]
MDSDEAFVALVHHDGRIRYKTKESVKFTDKSPANLFMTTRTTLVDLQAGISRKLGLDARKRVVEALRADDSDAEPEFIEGESNDETGADLPPQGGASSSGTQQYPTHLSDLNMDALSGPGQGASGASGATSTAQASQGSNMPAEFVVGQSFHTKRRRFWR